MKKQKKEYRKGTSGEGNKGVAWDFFCYLFVSHNNLFAS